MAENGYSPATRLFEAAGAGACQITDAWEGIAHFFEPGDELLVAFTPEDVARFVESVDVGEARAIGEAARARAPREHSYAARARRVGELLRAGGGVGRTDGPGREVRQPGRTARRTPGLLDLVSAR